MAEPFLTYLTIFQSRLGALKLVLDVTGTGRQPEARVVRRLQDQVKAKTQVDVHSPGATPLLAYLREKGLVTGSTRSTGRYRGLKFRTVEGSDVLVDSSGRPLDSFEAYQVDIWLADEAIPSTIAVPTEENVGELLGLTFAFRLLFKAKTSWTPAGQTIQSLRSLASAEWRGNPFLIGTEWAALLRQALAVDGLVLRETLRELVEAGGRVTRDEIALRFGEIVTRARSAAEVLSIPPLERRSLKDFESLITRTVAKRAKMSRAPGVLEHRVSPRLEWLVDLGFLRKPPGARNQFAYDVTEDASELLQWCDNLLLEADGPEVIASHFWAKSPAVKHLKDTMELAPFDDALRASYVALKPSIGPVPLSELAFVTSILCSNQAGFTQTMKAISDFAQSTNTVTLGRGRYARSDLTVHIPDAVLDAGSGA